MFWSVYSRPKFSTQMPFIIKICFTIKVNSICSAGRDTRNLRHKLNSQGTALRILGLSVTSCKSQGPNSRVLGVRVPCLRVPESRVSVSQVSGSQDPGSQGLRVSGPGSQVLILDYAILKESY